MNNDAASNGMPTGDNAPHFFDRYPADTARWLANLGDEANAKAGDNSFDFRRVLCELIVMGLRDGIPHALGVAEQLIAPNNQSVKYIEQQYAKYDQARAAVIETGPAPDTSTRQPDKPETPGGTSAEKAPEADGPTTNGTTGQSASGPGKPETTGPITVVGACGGVRPTAGNGQNTGIGQQGTLFVVHYSEFRASVPVRRKKVRAENKRLSEVRVTADREIAANDDELRFLDRFEAADAVLEDLVNTHRSETSIAAVLRAAGRTPHDLGLTPDTVTWLDTQLKAM